MNCPSKKREAEIKFSDAGGIEKCSLGQSERPECRGECVFGPRVRDVMTRNVIVVRETVYVTELAGLLSEKRISGVPVVDRRKRLVGVVSQADLVRPKEQSLMVDELLDGFIPEPKARVRDIMSREVHRVEESTFLTDAIDMMLREEIHRLIVTQGERVTGILTTTDLMRVLVQVLRN